MISSAGSVEESIVARIRCDWMKFRELLPLLTSKVFSLCTKGKIFQVCPRRVGLYSNETWAVKEEDLAKLQWCSDGTVEWMCTATQDSLAWGLVSIRNCIQRGRLSWFGHVEGMDRELGKEV